MIWVAVKPHAVGRVLKEVAPLITGDHLVASVAAGVTLKTLEKVSFNNVYNSSSNVWTTA